MTAAHCLEGAQWVLSSVGGGTLAAGAVQVRNSTTFTRHPLYVKTGYAYDIAVVTLPSAVTTVAPARVVTSASALAAAGSATVAVGRGFTGIINPDPSVDLGPGGLSSTLQEVDIPVVAHALCSNVFGSSYNQSQMICGGYWTGYADSCQGDSGGPLIAKGVGGDAVVGVTSFGCAYPHAPECCTRVHPVRDAQ